MDGRMLVLAYAAGVIDGEGCIGAYPRKRNALGMATSYQVMVRVGTTTPEMPEFLEENFGGNFREGKSNGKTIFEWKIADAACEGFLEEIEMFLREKRPQARVALQFMKLRRGQQAKYPGVAYPAEELMKQADLAQRLSSLKVVGGGS